MSNDTIATIVQVTLGLAIMGSFFGLLAFDAYCTIALDNPTGFIGCATKF